MHSVLLVLGVALTVLGFAGAFLNGVALMMMTFPVGSAAASRAVNDTAMNQQRDFGKRWHRKWLWPVWAACFVFGLALLGIWEKT